MEAAQKILSHPLLNKGKAGKASWQQSTLDTQPSKMIRELHIKTDLSSSSVIFFIVIQADNSVYHKGGYVLSWFLILYNFPSLAFLDWNDQNFRI